MTFESLPTIKPTKEDLEMMESDARAMDEMNFETEFPSLKEYTCFTAVGIKACYNEDIQKHCLDKQRVKEAIFKHTLDDVFNKLPISLNGHFYVRRDTLLKELGLE